jgi:hypothetical protein
MLESPEMRKGRENFLGGIFKKAGAALRTGDDSSNDDHQSIPDPNWAHKAQSSKSEDILSRLKLYDVKINPYRHHQPMRSILLNMETFAKVIEAPKALPNCAPARLCINIEDMRVLCGENLDLEDPGRPQKQELKDHLAMTNAVTREYEAMVELLSPLIGADNGKIPGAVVILGRSRMLPVVERLLQRMQELAAQYENWMLEAAIFQDDLDETGSADEQVASTAATVGE